MASTSTTKCCNACGLPPRLAPDQQTPLPLRRCSRCHKAWYHDVQCQRQHVAQHKQACRRNAAAIKSNLGGGRVEKNTTDTAIFRVEERPARGRSLVACQAISVGQAVSAPADIFSPLVPPVLNEANRHVRCALCFGMLDPSCVYTYDNNTHTRQYTVLLCSHECRRQGQPWLQEEERFVAAVCQSNARIQVLPTALLLYRVLRNIAMEDVNTASQDGSLRIKVDNLEAHNDVKQSPDEQNHVRAIVTVTKSLLDQRVRLVNHQEESILQSFSMQYMMQTISRIKTNAFTICDGESVALGVGLFHAASNINHSCRPNALQTFVYGREGICPSLRVTACTTLRPNEEVCISYMDNAWPRNLRRQRLHDDYHFECTCISCCDSKHDDFLVGVVCPKSGCSGKGRRLSQTDLAPQDASWECDACGNTSFTAATDLITAFHSQETNNVTTLQEQERMYASLKANFSPSSWYVCECAERLAQSLLDAIDGSDARETQRRCSQALKVFDEILAAPVNPKDKAWKVLKRQVLLYKRAKLQLFLLPDPRVAISELQNVMETLSFYYPKDHEFLEGLQDAIAQAFS